MIEELDNVELLEDFDENLKKGSSGTVVYVGGNKTHCFVEFFENDKTIAVKVVELKNLKKL